MGQLKRRRPQHLLRPDQMLSTLASLRLNALLHGGCVWLAMPPELAEMLNQCCTGQMDGGPGTAEEVAAVLAPLVGELQLPPEVRAAASREADNDAVKAAQLQRPRHQQQPAQRDVTAGDRQVQGPGPEAGPAPLSDAELTNQEQGVSVSGGGVRQLQSGGPVSTAAGEGVGGSGPEVGPGLGAVASGADVEMAEAEPEAEAGGVVARPEAAEAEAAETGPGGAPTTAADGSGAGSAAGPHGAKAAEAEAEGFMGGHQQARGGWKGRGGGGGGRERGRGRGRGRRGPPPPPFSPAAEGCRLVAVRLTLEESFFLHYVLRCLQVYELRHGSPLPATSEHVRLLDTEELWQACRAIRSNFVTSYAAYHHLKAKGWIPRSGLLYGVDYVVYQLHPAGAHSDFGVLVVPLGPGGLPAGPHTPPLGWLDLQITNRLINQVVKKLIVLYLYERPGPDHSSPACLGNFVAEERIVRRWVPDATRD